VVQRGERGSVHGLWIEANPEDVVLQSIRGGGPIHIPRDAITGMSVQRGYRNQGLRGALLGAGFGVLGGIIIAQTTDVFDGAGVAVGVSVGAALPVGLVIGLLTRSPEWEGIDMSALPPPG